MGPKLLIRNHNEIVNDITRKLQFHYDWNFFDSRRHNVFHNMRSLYITNCTSAVWYLMCFIHPHSYDSPDLLKSPIKGKLNASTSRFGARALYSNETMYLATDVSGLILGLHPANAKHRHKVTTSLIGKTRSTDIWLINDFTTIMHLPYSYISQIVFGPFLPQETDEFALLK